MRKIVSEGETVPQGYGIAWREFDRDVAICYPIPLHMILGWLRRAYIWLRFQTTPRALDRHVREIVRRAEWAAEARGYQRGTARREGFRQGWEAAFAKLEDDLSKPWDPVKG